MKYPLLLLSLSIHLYADPMPLAFKEDFSKGMENWQPTDQKKWKITTVGDSKVYELLGKSNYEPPHRSPHSISLRKDILVGSFELTARVQTTQTTRGHRDLCFFFNYQGPAKFYYVHLGEKPDPNSSQIFIVNGAPRTALTKSKTGIPWKDGEWHQIKIVRDVESGRIDVYFDDMKKPAKSVIDKTFTWGQIGIGSFDDKGYFDDITLHAVQVKRPTTKEKKKENLKSKTGGVSIKHISADKKVAVSLGSKLFTEYRYGNAKKPILYPIIGPHGISMTRNFPMKKGVHGEATDHPHHQSLYYVHIINGHDFWHARDGVEVRNDKIVKAEMVGDEAVMVSQNSWMKDETVVCTDTTELRFGETDGARYIDFKITMHASNGPITFNETKEGTMAIRTHPALRLKGDVAKGSAINSEGITGKSIWSKPAKWVNYWGPIDGNTVGIAIFDHPKNPRHPTTWHARDYGLITANPFGGKSFKSGKGAMKVAKDSSVTFAYRFLFHKGSHKAAGISKQYQQWIKK